MVLHIDKELDEVEYAKCEDRNLLIVLNSEKLADYNSGKCFGTILMVVLVTISNCFL
jgi:hypothetical protein